MVGRVATTSSANRGGGVFANRARTASPSQGRRSPAMNIDPLDALRCVRWTFREIDGHDAAPTLRRPSTAARTCS